MSFISVGLKGLNMIKQFYFFLVSSSATYNLFDKWLTRKNVISEIREVCILGF
jgi:hypothetical protein